MRTYPFDYLCMHPWQERGAVAKGICWFASPALYHAAHAFMRNRLMSGHPTPAAFAVLTAIGCYQRYVSPHKGFCCAHRARTGHASCSQFARRAIERRGLVAGLRLLRRRFMVCAASYRALLAGEQKSDTESLNEPCPLLTLRHARCCGEASVATCWLFS